MTGSTCKTKEWNAIIVENRPVGGYHVLSLALPRSFPSTPAGSFAMVSIGREPEILLRRPMAFFDVRTSKTKTIADILYQVAGKGTQVMTDLSPGTSLSLLGPIGNGFSQPKKGERVIIAAGGIGIAPFLLWIRQIRPDRKKNVEILFGFRTKEQKKILKYFTARGVRPQIALEGPGGDIRGTVVDLLKKNLEKARPDRILTCGPSKMMEAVQAVAQRAGVPLEASLEAKMGCGMGVCLSCVTEFGAPERPNKYSLVCQDGPVFTWQPSA